MASLDCVALLVEIWKEVRVEISSYTLNNAGAMIDL